MKQDKKIISIIFIALLFGILGFFTISVYANGSLSSERTIEEDDEKTFIRMATSLSKGESSNNELNTNILKSFFEKYLGIGDVDVNASTGDLINVQFNESGNLYEIDIFNGLIDFGQVDRYIIKYDANGGNLMPYMQIAEQGEQIKLTKMRPTKSGYTFLGWSTSNTATIAEYVSGDTYTVNGNVTLYAVWEQEVVETRTIIFNANGGTGAPSPQTAPKGQNIIISNQVPTKEGYTFLGWHTSSSATIPQYTAGGTYTGSSDITLYAVWEQEVVETYTITFNANGGTGAPNPQTAPKGQNIIISNQVPTKEGYTFLGWHISSSATTPQYTAGGTYTGSSDITLYAVWEQEVVETYTITFNANGGTGGPSPQTAPKGQNIIISNQVPTKEGYTFLGWHISSSATTPQYTAGGTYTGSSDITLYAVWEQEVVETYTITFNANGGTGGPTSLTGNAGETVTIPTDIPTKTMGGYYQYKFKGWATSSSASTANYQAGDTITLTQNMTLYAVWSMY